MKGDFSRQIFDKRKHYTGVLMQQGRVQVDADWNMQQAIQQYRIQTKSRDLIGLNGAPEAEAGFEINVSPDGNDLSISPGRIYVNGILCELERPTPVDVLEVSEVQVRVSRWIVDDESFEVGQWIEIYAEGIAPRLLQIVGVDSISRFLTFNGDVIDFQDTAHVKVHRIALFTHQLDYPDPPKYVKMSGPHNYGLGGTTCISKERCEAGVSKIELVVTIPGASPSWNKKEVGMVFNWKDDQNYWILVCKYRSSVDSSRSSPGVHVSVSTEIVKVQMGYRYVINSQGPVSKNVARTGERPPGEARFSIEQPVGYLKGKIKVNFGDKGPWDHTCNQGLPETILENSKVGMFTRFNGRAKFTRFVVEYKDTKRVLIPPERTDRVIGRLVVKPNFLRPVRKTQGFLGQSYSEMSTPSWPLRAEFERWFWVVPPGAVYWYAQGDMGIGADSLR